MCTSARAVTRLRCRCLFGQEGAGVMNAVGAEVKSVKSGSRGVERDPLGSYAEDSAVPGEPTCADPGRRE